MPSEQDATLDDLAILLAGPVDQHRRQLKTTMALDEQGKMRMYFDIEEKRKRKGKKTTRKPKKRPPDQWD